MKLKRFIPIIILIVGLVAFFIAGGNKYLSFSELSTNYASLKIYTEQHFFITSMIFILIYIAVAAFSIPGATVMTLAGGFLFGVFLGTLFVVISATIGAFFTYISVNSAFGSVLKNKTGGHLNKLYDGFKKNELGYMFFLRLVPVFPFFIINIAAGVLGVKKRNFLIGTLIGIIPGSFIYCWVGSGLSHTLSKGGQRNMGIIFEPKIFLPIIALAIISIIPALYKKVKQRKVNGN